MEIDSWDIRWSYFLFMGRLEQGKSIPKPSHTHLSYLLGRSYKHFSANGGRRMTLFSYLYLHKNAYNSGPTNSLDECETVLEYLCLALTVHK